MNPVALEHAGVDGRLPAAARQLRPTIPTVYRGPYEYSDPEAAEDYLPQWQAPARTAARARGRAGH